ncbi:MAG: type II secretion system F family protein, partial [Candidatus Buchananbacteria bacterium]|nr:type II secretion system F family protein [Candidatus Buchananbacteria bacterium]
MRGEKNKKKKNDKMKGRRLFVLGLTSDRDYFVENISMLISSGMGVAQALAVCSSEVRSFRMKRIVKKINEEVESGSTLWRAFEKARLFPLSVIALIRVGEESGRLAENLQLVSSEQEKERIFKSRIRSAMMYPIFVLSLTVIIGVGIAWFILPKLALVFSQLKLKLPLVTQVLIGVGNFLGENGTMVIPVFLISLI